MEPHSSNYRNPPSAESILLRMETAYRDREKRAELAHQTRESRAESAHLGREFRASLLAMRVELRLHGELLLAEMRRQHQEVMIQLDLLDERLARERKIRKVGTKRRGR